MDQQKSISVFFDFDGTLANLPIDYESMRRELSALYSAAGLKSTFRPLIPGVLKASKRLQKKAFEIIAKHELQAAEKARIPANAKRLVEKLSSRARLGIVSSNSRQSVSLVLEKSGLENAFCAIICREDCEKLKPDPAPLKKAVALCGADAKSSFFVGNAKHDVTAAKKAGVKSILFSPKELNGECDEADFIVSKIEDVEKVIEDDSILKFYEKKGAEVPELQKTYLSENPLRRRLYISRANAVFESIAPFLASGKRVLDIGCGGGWYLKKIAGAGAQAFGVDISKGYVDEAKKFAGPNAVVLQASALALPFKNGFFDAVLMTEVVEHTPSPEKAMREAWRVLKPGGIFVVTAPNSYSVLEQYPKLKAKIAKKRYEHIYEFTPRSFASLAKKHGFEVIGERYCGYFYVPFGLSALGTRFEKTIDAAESLAARVPIAKKAGWTMILSCKKPVKTSY